MFADLFKKMYSTILRKKVTMESLSRLSIKITGNIMCCADISRRNKTDKKRILLNGISVGYTWYSPPTEDLQGMDELPGYNLP